MLFLLFACKILSWRNEYMIGPKRHEIFWSHIGEGDALLTLELNQISSDGRLNYRIKTPEKDLSDNEFKPIDNESVLKNYKTKGTYTVEIFNASKDTLYFSLGSYVEKEIEVDADKAEMRNVLNRLKRDLRNIYNLNMQLSERKQENIKRSRKYKLWLQVLCLLPVVYALVGFCKLQAMKGFFTPSKK